MAEGYTKILLFIVREKFQFIDKTKNFWWKLIQLFCLNTLSQVLLFEIILHENLFCRGHLKCAIVKKNENYGLIKNFYLENLFIDGDTMLQ